MSDLQVERDGRVATLIINRPERSNAITPELATAMRTALLDLISYPEIGVVLLRGAGGRAFCGGFDLQKVTTGVRDDELQQLLSTLRKLPVPTVAVVDGHAVGAGLDLASSCDLRVVRAGSKIGLPAVRIGVAYHAEGLRRLVARMPEARRFLVTGELVAGESVLGFADVVASAEDLEAKVAELTQALLAASPSSMEYMLAMVRPGESMDPTEEIRWRNEILDGPDARIAAEARARGEVPVFPFRRTGIDARGAEEGKSALGAT